MRTYTYQLAAGDERGLTIKGRYLRVLRASGTIKIRLDAGAPAEYAQGIGVHQPRGFTDVNVQSDITQTVQIGVSDGVIDDNRLSLESDVSVVYKNLSGVGNAYIMGGVGNASVGNFSYVLLDNPVGSGVNIVIDRISLSAFGVLCYLKIDTGLGPGIFPGKNKVIGQPDIPARMNIPVNAVSLGTFIAQLSTDAAGTPYIFNFETTPLILPPGHDVAVVPLVTNNAVQAHFEWREEPV